MQRNTLAAVAAAVILGGIALPPTAGQAQLMVDMSKVTCGQYIAMPPDQSRIFPPG